jgi:hypothetical protein
VAGVEPCHLGGCGQRVDRERDLAAAARSLVEVTTEGVGVEVQVLLGEAGDPEPGDVVAYRRGCRRNLTEAGLSRGKEPEVVECDLGHAVWHEQHSAVNAAGDVA